MTNQHIPTEGMEERFSKEFNWQYGDYASMCCSGEYCESNCGQKLADEVLTFIRQEITLALQKREEELLLQVDSLFHTGNAEYYQSDRNAVLNEVYELFTH